MPKKSLVTQLSICFLREKKSFIAYSPALDLSTCGKTLEEAKNNFKEALEIFFEECSEMGTVDKVLESLGWEKLGNKKWAPPIPIHEETMDIPEVVFA